MLIIFNETTYIQCAKYFEELPSLSTRVINLVEQKETSILSIDENDTSYN